MKVKGERTVRRFTGKDKFLWWLNRVEVRPDMVFSVVDK